MTRKTDRAERIRQRQKMAGAQQPLPTVGAQTTRDILNAEAREKLRGGQAPVGGIFGDAHKQKELF